MNENKKNNKKKSGFPWALLILLIPLLKNLDEDAAPVALVAIAALVLIGLAFTVIKNKAAQTRQSMPDRPARPAPVRPAMQRREPVTPAHRDFPEPEAYCVSCELSGEDHFVRDRQRRLQQLDEWLKNGLIDRAEYQVLKRRFERDQ